MAPLSESSSSEEELEVMKPKEDLGVLSKPIDINTNTPVAISSSKDKDGQLQKMLKLVLEAVRLTPSENRAKGISVQKIKAYLRDQHGIRKMVIQEQLRPTLETAINRKMLLKTSGRASVLIGSLKLNPDYDRSSTEDSGSSDEEPVAKEKQVVDIKKRKAARETEAIGSSKRRK